MRRFWICAGDGASARLLPLVAILLSTTPNSGGPVVEETRQSNEIVGEPFVSCATDAIYAKWKTRSTFRGGSVSVRHAPRDRPCYQTLITNNQIELLIPHLDCRLDRLRILNPPSLLIEATVLISFHGDFLSAGDKIFNLKCLHSGTPKRPGNGTLFFGTLPPPADRHTVPAPACSYDIFVENDSHAMGRRRRRVSPGERLAIGTPIFHEWSCSDVRESHCLVVANCMLRTPEAERQIIDEFGCSTVPDLVPQLNYATSTTVRQRIAIFTIKEPSSLYFQCQLSLIDVPLDGNSTDRRCPVPKCTKRQKRDTSTILDHIQSPGTQVVDLLSTRFDVAAFDEPYSNPKADSSLLSDAQLVHLEQDDVCLSTAVAALASFMLVTLSSAATVVVLLKCMRDRIYQAMSH